jgi:hypothetical protein
LEFRLQAAQDRVNAELLTDETSGATVGRYPVPAGHQMGVAGVAGCAPPMGATKFRGATARLCHAERSEASGQRMGPTLVGVLGPDPSLTLRACPDRSRRDDRTGPPRNLVAHRTSFPCFRWHYGGDYSTIYAIEMESSAGKDDYMFVETYGNAATSLGRHAKRQP